MTTDERLTLLAACADLFEEYTGPFDKTVLENLVKIELGHPAALDQATGPNGSRRQAHAPHRILHVLSGNTPHAAFQSLLRGLVIGGRNHLKLPGSGLPVLETALERLPAALRALVTTSSELPDDWNTAPGVVVVYGTDATIEWFTRQTPPHIRLIPHGQRLSIGLVTGDPEAAAPLAARDVSLYEQQGCLSTHAVYVHPGAGCTPSEFAALLADAMDAFNASSPRGPLTASEAGAITNLRETVRFLGASRPDQTALWESPGSTAWTVIMECNPLLKASTLNRVVYVKPWPAKDPLQAFGDELRHLACLALHPFPEPDPAYTQLGASRICAMGDTQFPPLTWHQDGIAPLAALVDCRSF